tara:strand:+ start:664 stop:2643 length:1980 start_codon:yes stop_codon:yes gene_type:complete
MAINFLNHVDFNQNELRDAVIENQADDAGAGTGIDGQLYYNTDDDVLKVWTGTAWTSVGSDTYTLTGVGSTNTTAKIRLSDGDPANDNDVSINGTGSVTVTQSGNVLTIDGSDDAGVETVEDGGGIIVTNKSGPTATVSVAYSNIATNVIRSAGTAATPALADELIFEDVSGVVRKTSVSNLLSSVPAGANTTYTLPVTNGSNPDLVLTAGGSGSGTDIVNLNGSTNINVTGSTLNTVEFALANTVSVTGSITAATGLNATAGPLTVGSTGVSSFAGDVTVPQTPAGDASAASKYYVDQSNIGQSVFQGGYNADTNTPDLDSSPSSSIKQGWFYAVTIGGTFFSETVQPGDLIFANQDDPGATFSNWTVVQAGQDIATAGTNANAIRGISAYDSATFSVNASGFVTSTIYTGGNAKGIVPTGGSAGEYLEGNGSFSTPTDSGITGVTLATGTGATVPLSESITGRELTLTSNIYSGQNTVGAVPSGGNNTTFLRGDGAWVTPTDTVGAVLSVDETTPGTSTGTPIIVAPTTGNVLVKSMAYAGDTKVGHVPTGGGDDNTLSLRGDASWQRVGKRVSLNSSLAYVSTPSDSGGIRTWTVAIDNAAVFGTGALGMDVKAEIVTAAGDTVYADITRATNDVLFAFTGTPANGTYEVLLTYIG